MGHCVCVYVCVCVCVCVQDFEVALTELNSELNLALNAGDPCGDAFPLRVLMDVLRSQQRVARAPLAFICPLTHQVSASTAYML